MGTLGQGVRRLCDLLWLPRAAVAVTSICWAISIFPLVGLAETNLLTNGSFEAGCATSVFNIPAGNPIINPWTIVTGQIDYIAEPYWPASDGQCSLDLDGGIAGAISQSITTVVGAAYTLVFDMGANASGIKTIRASVAGSIATFTASGAGYLQHSLTFVATGSSTSILLESLTPGSLGPKLDNVRVFPCASGAVGSGEACDDGNTINGDGCSSTCQIEPCWACAGEPSVCTPLPPTFGSATQYSVGGGPVVAAVGDFNADGRPDAAVANSGSDNVSVLLGNGAGFGAATNYPVGSEPWGIAASDFNGDGKLDLVVSNERSDSVSVLLGSGAGTFGGATNFATGTGPKGVGVGDFNGDMKLDLATANDGGHDVSVLLGDGSGGFSAPTNLPSAGLAAQAVAVADFNADSKLDLAVTYISSDVVSVVLGTGTGTFGAATNFSSGSLPRSVVARDLSGDGKLDLVVGNQGSDNVSVLLGNGSGGFAAATHFAAGSSPFGVAVDDFDADGKWDVAVANRLSNNISLLRGTGTGSLATAVNFATDNGPLIPVTADVNNDDAPDLIVTELNANNVGVLLNQLSCASRGAPCVGDDGCFSGFCVDGVCCNSGCGGNTGTDCQACGVAAGATIDGTCSALTGTSCSDGLFCNGTNDTCSSGACSIHTGDPCTGGNECNNACNEAADNCFNSSGTACSDELNPCTVDQCDGSGTCGHNAGNAGALCRPAVDACDASEVCDGANTTCPSDVFAGSGTPCGDPADTLCTDPDSCDGDGGCQANHASASTVCRADAGQCDVAEQCDGNGGCPPDAFESSGTACNDNSICTQTDQCNGSGTCVGSNPLACDDNNACTANDCDPINGCENPPAPASGCKSAAKALLILKQSGGLGDKQLFKWVNGDILTLADLADPTTSTSYGICMYSGPSNDLLESISVPPGAPNWRAAGSIGYKYKELNGTNSGITKMLFRGNDTAGKSKALVKGKGANLPDPTIGNMQTPVTVQVINPDTGACVEAVFDSNDVKKNTSTLFKAKAQQP